MLINESQVTTYRGSGNQDAAPSFLGHLPVTPEPFSGFARPSTSIRFNFKCPGLQVTAQFLHVLVMKSVRNYYAERIIGDVSFVASPLSAAFENSSVI